MWLTKAISQLRKKRIRPPVLLLRFRNISDGMVHVAWSKRCSKKALALADILLLKFWQSTDLQLCSPVALYRERPTVVIHQASVRTYCSGRVYLLDGIRCGLATSRILCWLTDTGRTWLRGWSARAPPLWSRLVAGWHLDNNMEEDLVITAFRRAALGRQPAPGLIVHSDRAVWWQRIS